MTTETEETWPVKESAFEALRGRAKPLLVPTVLTVILVLVGANLRSNFLNSQGAAALTACKSNLKNIGVAMEMYSEKNSGHFPVTLASLTPNYLKTIPECRYQDQGYKLDGPDSPYNTAGFKDYFIVWCAGDAHKRDHGPPDYPKYDWVQGLIER